MSEEIFTPMRWQEDTATFQLLDQTLLPQEETWIDCTSTEIVADAIRRLAVRGAPAIGVTAAFGLVVASPEGHLPTILEAADYLESTRPTAVNLKWALDIGRELAQRPYDSDADRAAAILAWAKQVHAEDIETNRRMGANGAALFERGDKVVTHCNAGGLATGGFGTAVGVIRAAHARGELGMVWVDETRPLLQGARLTSWELGKLDIPHRLVTDSSIGALVSRGLVDRVVVGADRIAANGDVANKIGTYTVAVLAHRHGVPFYVAAPLSTIDRHTPSGADIPIEEREGSEVTSLGGQQVAPDGTEGMNFAFDVTPNELVAAIITEEGVLEAPFGESIAAAFERSGK